VEIFKDVVGYEGLYQISNKGSIKALLRTSYQKGRWGLALVTFPERNMRIFRTGAGYNYIALCKDGVSTKHLVHRLVLAAFNGKSDLQCNHKDGNKDNNNIENLEYVTSLQNLRHCIDVLNKKRGEGMAQAKLKEKDIKKIRTDKRILKEIAADYGVSLQAIFHVKSGKNWAYVK
jgi:hypothetical protein